MARRLVKTKLSLGLLMIAAASSAPSARSQQADSKSSSTAQVSAVQVLAAQDSAPQVEVRTKPIEPGSPPAPSATGVRSLGAPNGPRPSSPGGPPNGPPARSGGQHRDGGRGSRFIMEAVRRDGGPLELLPLLKNMSVCKEIGLDEQFQTKLNTYQEEMQKRIDEERRSAESNPSTNWPNLFRERLEKENELFQAFMNEMPAHQRDRLLEIFVQYRNVRALSNRLIAVDKLGMTNDTAAKLKSDINRIRDETIRESMDEMRRLFDRNVQDNGDFKEHRRKNNAKIDSRIEKLISKSDLEKLATLRGKEVPIELLDSIDTPPLRPKPPGR
ncbi:MAG: hypothetical protein IT423_10070 [Pirellulaceae bacterium]|nr:hypothetical protein [Pirellulaceae bacterium]